MSQTNKHWQTCRKCLERGDFGAAEAVLGKMQKALGLSYVQYIDDNKIVAHKEESLTLLLHWTD
jgi:hypothetical protein